MGFVGFDWIVDSFQWLWVIIFIIIINADAASDGFFVYVCGINVGGFDCFGF